MKVLYIGYYKEPTGWGQAARDNIKALLSVGVDVVCRNITLTKDIQIEDQILFCEQKECHDATHCIQHVLPYHYTGTNKYEKNIAYLECESSLNNTSWISNLELMDEVWAPSESCFKDWTVMDQPYYVVNHPCDILKYRKNYKKMSIAELDHKYKFYTICDLNDRKNLECMIKCFHHEFDRSEQVALILKVKKTGYSSEQVNKYVSEMCKSIKSRLRIYNTLEDYHPDIIISEDLTEDTLMSLHMYADCYLNTSRGEAWSIPTFDAMALGNHPIVPAGQGMDEYINENVEIGTRVFTSNVIAESQDSSFSELFTGQDFWSQIDEKEFCKAMRFYYNNRFKYSDATGYSHALNYSYNKIGEKMVSLL